MAKNSTPSFVLTVEMNVNNTDIHAIESNLEVSRVIYNTCLGELLKREKQMKRTKSYKKKRRCLRAVSEKLSHYQTKKNKEKVKFYQEEKNKIMETIFSMQKQFSLTEYEMHDYSKLIRNHFGDTLNANVAQKVATRAWNTFNKKLKGEAKKVKFLKRNDMFSFEGKNNTTGWRYKNKQIIYGNSEIELKTKEKDVYLAEAIANIENKIEFTYTNTKGELKKTFNKVKYVRILKRIIRGRVRYYAQLTIQGFPPSKRNKDGSFKHKLGIGLVGGDLGTSSVAVTGKNKVSLVNLADNIDNLSRKIRLIQRKMDRSKRAMNPINYRVNGTINKGEKSWVFSNNYLKLKSELRETHRKQADCRKQSHNRLANLLLPFGDKHYWEEMNIKALQRRSKKTEISEKTGKFKRKKRFGKTISHRAPAMFMSILERKVKSRGGTFKKVNTWKFKASQYDHKTNVCKKKELKDRWHLFDDGTKVQRDLYSSFLLMNSNRTGTKASQKSCIKTFESFLQLHNKEIERIEKLGSLVLNSGIRLKTNKDVI